MKINKHSVHKMMIITGLLLSFAIPAFAWDRPQKGLLRALRHIPSEIINTGCLYESGSVLCNNAQSKNGPLITDSFLKAGSNFSWSGNGSIVSEKSIFAYRGDSFLHKMFAPGTDSKVVTGYYRGLYANDTSKVPLISDATSFRNSTTAIENQFNMLADAQFCNTQTMITTDTPAVQFWNIEAGSNATIGARGVQLSGGNPQPGKVLVSTDGQGNAIWATPQLETDGVTITFLYSDPSPVVSGQSSCD